MLEDSARESRALREASLQERARRSEAAVLAVSRLMGGEAASCQRMCLGAWAKVLAERRRADLEAAQQRLATVHNRKFESALGCMALSADRALKASCLGAMRDAARESRALREASLQERARRSEAAVLAVSRLMGGEASSMQRMCLGAWAKVLAERRKADIEAAQQRLAAQHQKRFEGALGCLSLSSQSALRHTCFAVWLAQASWHPLFSGVDLVTCGPPGIP